MRTHTHDKWIFKTDQLVANSLITQLVVIKEVDISRFTETIRQRKSYPSHNIMARQMWTTAPDSHIHIKSSAAAIKMTMTLKENILVRFGQTKTLGDSCWNLPACTQCDSSISDRTKICINTAIVFIVQTSCSCTLNICETDMHMLSASPWKVPQYNNFEGHTVEYALLEYAIECRFFTCLISPHNIIY